MGRRVCTLKGGIAPWIQPTHNGPITNTPPTPPLNPNTPHIKTQKHNKTQTQNLLAYYERRPWQWLREQGLKFALSYIHAEDKQTNYVDIGPVNKVGMGLWFGVVVMWRVFHGPQAPTD